MCVCHPPLKHTFHTPALFLRLLCEECALFTVPIQARVRRGVGGKLCQQQIKKKKIQILLTVLVCGSTAAACFGSRDFCPIFKIILKVFIHHEKRDNEGGFPAVDLLTCVIYFAVGRSVRVCVGGRRTVWRSLPCAPGVLSLQFCMEISLTLLV